MNWTHKTLSLGIALLGLTLSAPVLAHDDGFTGSRKSNLRSDSPIRALNGMRDGIQAQALNGMTDGSKVQALNGMTDGSKAKALKGVRSESKAKKLN